MHPDLLSKSEALAALCRAYGVARLELFGSAARGHDFNPQTSDFDFLVEFQREPVMSPLTQFFGLAEELEALLGRHVDLVEARSVKNPFVQASINQSRTLVFGM